MLKIRFQRVGRKHEPVFRLVLVDSHEGPKTGNVKEVLGSYDSRRGEKAEFKTDRIKHWIGLGAKASDTVHNMLISKKIIEGKKINVLPKKSPLKKEGEAEAAPQASTAPAASVSVEETPAPSEPAPAETSPEAETPASEPASAEEPSEEKTQ